VTWKNDGVFVHSVVAAGAETPIMAYWMSRKLPHRPVFIKSATSVAGQTSHPDAHNSNCSKV